MRVGTLNAVPISLRALVVPLDYLVLYEIPYDILIGLTVMILLCYGLDYYRMALKIRDGEDSEILKYEYERDNRSTSEDEFTSDSTDEEELEVK